MSIPARVTKLGFLEIRTSDVARLCDYYANELGLQVVEADDREAYLTTGQDHHCLHLLRGDAHGRARVGLQVAEPLDLAQRSLAEQGVEAERRSDVQAGVSDVLALAEPGTDAEILLYRAMAGSGARTPFGLRPTKLGHVACYAPDLAVLQDFYQRYLGFRWSDTLGDFFVFLRCGPEHHTINIMESRKRAGLHHLAFEVRDIVHLKDVLDHLAKGGRRLVWGPGRHGPGHNLFSYHRDPDGNLVEVFTEIDLMLDEEGHHWEPRPWHEEFPMGPKVWQPAPEAANNWGPFDPELLDH
ncbi:MAG: VOC family protein [Candidatus Dormibacteraceae bacterium]